MDRYIGIDAHSQSCTIAILGPSGRRLKSQVLETNGKALTDAIKHIPGRKHLCIEEGTQSDWLHEILAPHVDEIVVTMPPKQVGQRDDLRDAFARAEELRTGELKTKVFKAPKQFSGLRNAVRAYGMVIRSTRRP